MGTSRITQLWHERPWKRRKAEKDVQSSFQAPTPGESPPQHNERSLTATLERNAKRLSRIWKVDEREPAVQRHDSVLTPAPARTYSLRGLRSQRSFFRTDDEPRLVEEPAQERGEPLPPPLQRETLLARIKRRSQSINLPRPSTSSGIPRRRTFWGGTSEEHDEPKPAMPVLPDTTNVGRPRHVPISIEHLQSTATDGPGMAITTNDIRGPSHAFSDKPRPRPMSSSSSFSQLRVRPQKTSFNQHQGVVEESGSSDEDVLTALPSMDFKDFHIAELRAPGTHAATSPPKPERQSIQRVTPKIIDIVSPRPMTMISSTPARKPAPGRERHKSMIQPTTTSTPIGALEDGPKGDWSRTRHSWVGIGDGDFEQLEWDKLKQFMEAYGNGQDGGIISVRAVNGTDSSESSGSGSVRNSNGAKFSNAQALAALEFGL